MDCNMILAHRMREYREENHLSQNRLGAMLHVSQDMIWKYKKGKTGIPLDVAIGLAKLTNQSLDSLIREEKISTKQKFLIATPGKGEVKERFLMEVWRLVEENLLTR